jgi:uncharacterized protein with ParB-like and HNH nuclease domain
MNNLVIINNYKMTVTSQPKQLFDSEIKDCVFEVPIYQREYSWELTQVSDLLIDIENCGDEGHFLGSLLLYKPDDSNFRELIDGQQRLTTLFLILFAIRKCITVNDWASNDDKRNAVSDIEQFLFQRKKSYTQKDNSNEPRLISNNRDKLLFREIIKGDAFTSKKKLQKKSHKLMLSALDSIEVKLNETDTELLSLLEKITKCTFIIMTAERREDQKLLFKTLNSRGVTLSESDLVKNELCAKTTQTGGDDKKINDVVRLWDEMRDNLERNKSNIDLYLFHYINSIPTAQELRLQIDPRANKKRKSDEIINYYPPITEKLVFDGYERLIKETTSAMDFTTELNLAADLYIDISNPKDNTEKGWLSLQSLKDLNVTKCYPLLLRAKYMLRDKEFEKLAKAIEVISFRHSVIKGEPKDLENLYYNMLSDLSKKIEVDELINQIKNHPTIKNESQFEKAFLDYSPKETIGKLIIKRIIRDIDKQEDVDYSKKATWFEHIMPQSPKGEWLKFYNIDADEYETYVNAIGNLTFLRDVINIGASNENFNIKKEKFYVHSVITQTLQILEYDNWNYKTIRERQAKLYPSVAKIWSIN